MYKKTSVFNFQFSDRQRGFTLFAALIASSILVLISFAISAITTRESTLANMNRESGQAIFAANAGVECALYWDAKSGVAPAYTSAFSTSTSGSVLCNSTTVDNGSNAQNPIPGTTTASRIGGGGNTNPISYFGFSLNSGASQSNACAIVSVKKYYDVSGLVTEISSRGYNNCNISDPRRVERGIFVKY